MLVRIRGLATVRPLNSRLRLDLTGPPSAVSPESPGGDTDQRRHDSPWSEHDRSDNTAAEGEEEGPSKTAGCDRGHPGRHQHNVPKLAGTIYGELLLGMGGSRRSNPGKTIPWSSRPPQHVTSGHSGRFGDGRSDGDVDAGLTAAMRMAGCDCQATQRAQAVGVQRSGGTTGQVFDVFGESLRGELEPFGHSQIWVEGVGDLVDRRPILDRHDGGLDDVAGTVGEDVGPE